MTVPATTHPPVDSRLRGNDGAGGVYDGRHCYIKSRSTHHGYTEHAVMPYLF